MCNVDRYNFNHPDLKYGHCQGGGQGGYVYYNCGCNSIWNSYGNFCGYNGNNMGFGDALKTTMGGYLGMGLASILLNGISNLGSNIGNIIKGSLHPETEAEA